jgi:two-component system chemotaxis sensor kinase CheA
MAGDQQLQHRLRGLFAEELEDGLQLLGQGLLVLEEQAAAGSAGELVQQLFRTAHSLKGAAHAAVVPEAVVICDRLESTLAAVRDGEQMPTSELVTRLLGETDALARVARTLQQVAAPAAPSPVAPRPAASAPPPAAEPAAVPAQPTGSVRVTADRVDAVLQQAGAGLAAAHRLHELVGDAARAAEQVEAVRGALRSTVEQRHDVEPRRLATLLDDATRAVTALARNVAATDRALHHTSSGIAEAAQRLRTQRFADACSSLDRVVRDIARSTGKSARLVVSGEDIDVDRSVVAALRDPLLHLVRNAVDHGLELPQVRAAAGKPEIGTVEIRATLEGSLLHVTVRDDGAGIDTDALREEGDRRGLALPADDGELAFLPGLTTRGAVTDVSGRGVGMDAARGSLEQLGGSLQLESRRGTGTEVHLTAPVTLAVLRVLLVRAGPEVVALPTSTVARVVQVDPQELREVEGSVLLPLGERSVKAVGLADAVGFTSPAGTSTDGQLGVVIPRGSDVVLVTDGLLDELEIAVQPVPLRLRGAHGVLGVAAIQDGLPVLVVNPVAVGRGAPPLPLAGAETSTRRAARVLLAEDTVTTRALERSILESAGYSVAVAVDGADAWQQLQSQDADLVVSDVDMPRMSGIELCRQIRSSPRFRELPVVLVTSLDSKADRQRGLEAGADAYVIKSELQQGSLLDTIARLL